MRYILFAFLLVSLASFLFLDQSSSKDKLPAIRISDSGRYLVEETGESFFWLGDTAWKLFAGLDKQEAKRYLKDRKQKKFTVIQAHLLDWEFNYANAYGEVPFRGGDIISPNEAYWQHADYIINQAEKLGLYMALLPIWAGSHIEPKKGKVEGKVLYNDTLAAYNYGKFLGNRYRNKSHIIWILGGDTWGTRDTIYHKLAQGLADGAAGGNQDKLLMSFHPQGGTYRPPATSTGEFYHNQKWLDFNMIQSGHSIGNKNYERIQEDYHRQPIKPTLDSEPCYEAHPVKHKYENGMFTAWHLRRRAYWSLLAGACGFTYGANGIWQMDKPGSIQKESHYKDYWYDALDYEGAQDMTSVRELMESRPFINPERIPDQSILVSEAGAVDDRVQCARAADSSYWMLYITNGREVTINLSQVSGQRCQAWWYNPRDGKRYDESQYRTNKPFATFDTGGEQVLDPPGESGQENDWVLVLDDAAKGYSIPGM